MFKIEILFVVAICFGTNLAQAQDDDFIEIEDEAIEETEGPKSRKKEVDSLTKQLIDGNIAISKWFDGVAEGLDLFLVGERVTKQVNKTNVKLENATTMNEGEKPVNTTGLSVNVRLPNVENYFHLKFSDFDENEEKRSIVRGPLRSQQIQKNYGATVGVFRKLGNVRTSFQPRIELQDPLKVGHSLIFESVADVKKYKINPKIEFFAKPDDGTGIYLAVNFNYVLTKVYSLTWINDGEYKDKLHLFTVTNGVSLGQLITKKSSLSYNLFFGSNNQPSYHLESYNFSVSWSHLIYRNVLNYSVSPYLNFVKDKNFTGLPGIALNVGLNF